MPLQPEPPIELHALQAAFGRGLRAESIAGQDLQLLAPGPDATTFAQQFDVYRNNAWQFFQAALERSFPVVRKRVGAEFFRQLGREYRVEHPSRHGDLHWVGAAYPAWLAARLAGTAYQWLADLARLEWACEQSVVAGSVAPVPMDQLANFAPETLAHLELSFQPSVQQVDSPYPVWTVWQSNQRDDDAGPRIDLAQGGEYCAVACVADRTCVYRLDAPDYRLLQLLSAGRSLGDALAESGTGADVLTRLLAWAFAEGLVIGIRPAVES